MINMEEKKYNTPFESDEIWGETIEKRLQDRYDADCSYESTLNKLPTNNAIIAYRQKHPEKEEEVLQEIEEAINSFFNIKTHKQKIARIDKDRLKEARIKKEDARNYREKEKMRAKAKRNEYPWAKLLYDDLTGVCHDFRLRGETTEDVKIYIRKQTKIIDYNKNNGISKSRFEELLTQVHGRFHEIKRAEKAKREQLDRSDYGRN